MRTLDSNAKKACGIPSPKKDYASPQLICHGNIKSLTRGGLGNPSDAQSTGSLDGTGSS